MGVGAGAGGRDTVSLPSLRGHDPLWPALSQDTICTEHQSRHARGLMQRRGPGGGPEGPAPSAWPLSSVPHLHTRRLLPLFLSRGLDKMTSPPHHHPRWEVVGTEAEQ